MVQICFNKKYLDLYYVIALIRFKKALKSGIVWTDEWSKIVNNVCKE